MTRPSLIFLALRLLILTPSVAQAQTPVRALDLSLMSPSARLESAPESTEPLRRPEAEEPASETQASKRLEPALDEGRFPECDDAEGEWLWLWYLSDLGSPIHLIGMPFAAGFAPPGESGLWWGYFATKVAAYLGFFGFGALYIGESLCGLPHGKCDKGSDNTALYLSLSVTSGVVALLSNVVFVPRIADARRERCHAQKLAGHSCDSPRSAEASGFTVSPMVLPDTSGSTVYGLAGGFQF